MKLHHEPLIKAIDAYTPYPVAVRKVLKAFVQLSSEGKVVILPAELATILKLTTPSVYRAIKVLAHDKIIEAVVPKRVGNFIIHINKLDHILDQYEKKLSL